MKGAGSGPFHTRFLSILPTVPYEADRKWKLALKKPRSGLQAARLRQTLAMGDDGTHGNL